MANSQKKQYLVTNILFCEFVPSRLILCIFSSDMLLTHKVDLIIIT